MIKALALLLIVSSLQSLKTEKPEDGWLTQDKLLHISMSSVMVSTLYHLHQCKYGDSKVSSQIFAAQITISLGITKEIKDAKFSSKDLIADLLGITIGLLLLIR